MDSQYRSETLIKAYMLLALAVAKDPTDGGSARAEAPKAKIAGEMTPELIAEALRRAELFGNKRASRLLSSFGPGSANS